VDPAELTRFHTDDYVNFLRTITPDNMADHLRELQRCEATRRGGLGGGGREETRAFSFAPRPRYATLLLHIAVNVGEDCPGE